MAEQMAEYVNHFAHKNTDRHHFREESSLENPLFVLSVWSSRVQTLESKGLMRRVAHH